MLIDHLPKVHVSDELKNQDQEVIIQVLERRENVEYTRRLLERASQLVSRARITPEFRDSILARIESHAIEGADWLIDQPGLKNEWYYFLDSSRPDSGGIFDVKKLRYI